MNKMNWEINELKSLKKALIDLKKEYLNIVEENEIIKENTKEIITSLSKIYEEAFNNISKVSKIKNYGDLYLPLYIKGLDKYNSLKKKNTITKEITKFYDKMESLSETLKEHFHTKYKSMLNDDLIVNDAEIDALLKTIK